MKTVSSTSGGGLVIGLLVLLAVCGVVAKIVMLCFGWRDMLDAFASLTAVEIGVLVVSVPPFLYWYSRV